jgi:hypothetical protein
MTKRNVENDIDELREDLLGELSPAERLTLTMEAVASGARDSTERLRETCPQRTYRGPDAAYIERWRLAARLRDQVVYTLHTTALRYEHLETEYRRRLSRELEEGGGSAADEEAIDLTIEQANQLDGLFAQLYATYHGAAQFAEDRLGVTLETWLEEHDDGAEVCELVELILADEMRAELAEKWLNNGGERPYDEDDGGEDDDDAWRTLDDAADDRYETYEATWVEVIEMIPGETE